MGLGWGRTEGQPGGKEDSDSDRESRDTEPTGPMGGFDVGLREGRESKDFPVS